MFGFAIGMAEIAVEKKEAMCSADVNDVGQGNYFEFLVVAITYVEILESEQHKGKIRDLEWRVASDEECDSIPGGPGAVLAHDIHSAHPNEQNGCMFSMSNRRELAISEINTGIRLARRVIQLRSLVTNE